MQQWKRNTNILSWGQIWHYKVLLHWYLTASWHYRKCCYQTFMLKMHDSLSPLVKAIMACFSLKGSMTSKEKDNLGFKWLRGIKVYIYFLGCLSHLMLRFILKIENNLNKFILIHFKAKNSFKNFLHHDPKHPLSLVCDAGQ